MYEYKFVRVTVEWDMLGSNQDLGYQKKIQTEARSGWRLVQILPLEYSMHRMLKYCDLVFEREK